MSLRVPSLFLVLGFLSTFQLIGEEIADLVLVNGKILTVDSAFSVHSAMAVRGDRILALGMDSEIEQMGGSSTRVINLKGRTVIPGLIDSHTHAAGACLTEFDHPIPEMQTIQQVLEYIRSRARVLPKGEWIYVSQVFLTRLKEQRYPSREELDSAAPDHPAVFRTGPDASVNSLALSMSGIDKNWEVSDGGPGFAEKDPDTGELTGILRSCTRYLAITRSNRKPTTEEHLKELKKLILDYNRVGITTFAERDVNPDEISLYDELHKRGQLTTRVYLSRHIDSIPPIPQIRREIEEVASSPYFEGDPMLRLSAVKAYLDGGMLTGSAYMLKPWGTSKIYGITDPEYKGLQFIPDEKLRQILEICFENKVQFMAHSVGDGAVHAFINACRSLESEYDIRSRRPVICHSNFMTEEAVKNVADLGIPVDIQPAWLFLDGRTLHQHFGYDRLSWFQPLKALFAAGAVAGGGSDHMQKIGSIRSINFYDPWKAFWVTMTRRANWLEQPIHEEHALSKVEALRFYTINNAYLLFAEKELGSLEPGKFADFVVLNDDFMNASVDDIPRVEVSMTFVGGKPVFTR